MDTGFQGTCPEKFKCLKPQFSPLHPYTQDTEIGLGALV